MKETEKSISLEFEYMVKNINDILRPMSYDEMSIFFDDWEKKIDGVVLVEDNISMLLSLDTLKKVALDSKKNFDVVLDLLINVDDNLEWKSVDESIVFFDRVDLLISQINTMNLRQTLMLQAKDFRVSKIDIKIVDISQDIFDRVDENYSIAWSSKVERELFFENVDSRIKLLSNKDLANALLVSSSIYRENVLREFQEDEFDFNCNFLDEKLL